MTMDKVAPVGSTEQQQSLLSARCLVLARGGTPEPQSNSVDPPGPPQPQHLPTSSTSSSTASASSIPLRKSNGVKVEVVVNDEQQPNLRMVEDSHRQETLGGKETEQTFVIPARPKALTLTRGNVLSSSRRCNAPDCYISTRWACRCQTCRRYDKNGVIICHKCFAKPAQHEKAADVRHNMGHHRGRWKHPIPWQSVLPETTAAVSAEQQQPLPPATSSVIAGGGASEQSNSVNPQSDSQLQHSPTSSSSSSSTPREASSTHAVVVGHARGAANEPETNARQDAEASPTVAHGDATATKGSSERECSAEQPLPCEHQIKRVKHHVETAINKDNRDNSSPCKSKPEGGEIVVKSEHQDPVA